ncbi:MAG: hypothetical protein PHI97_33870 [Desulfobulbus sp.]|nr:hypothetical protein [Desulfobulbus sp.]
MKSKLIIYFILFFLLHTVSFSIAGEIINQQKAIKIAIDGASRNEYNIENIDIETLKVTDGYDSGPVRLSWVIMRLSSKEAVERILNSKFWIVYFYPKDAFINQCINHRTFRRCI